MKELLKTAYSLGISALISLSLVGCAVAEGSTATTTTEAVSHTATPSSNGLARAINRMYEAYEDDAQQMSTMRNIYLAAQEEVQPSVPAADWADVNSIRARIEADVHAKKLTGYDLMSEVMVYGQSMSLLAAGEPIPKAAIEPELAEPSNLAEALEAAKAGNFASKLDAVGAIEDLHRFMKVELGAVVPASELSKVELHRVNASLVALKEESTLDDISGDVSAYIAGLEDLVRKYG